MALECYFISGSPFAWRVLLGLELKGLEYKATQIHGSKGDNKTPEYLAMNPHGQVPVLKDGDVTIYESLAILAYLDRKYPEKPLFGATAEEGALIWQRTMDIQSHLLPVLGGVLRPVFTGNVDGNEDAINAEVEKLKTELARYEGWLAEGDYLAGGSISATDISLYPPLAIVARIMSSLDNAKIDKSFLPYLDGHPVLAGWMARIEALDGFDAVYPPHWRAAKAAE